MKTNTSRINTIGMVNKKRVITYARSDFILYSLHQLETTKRGGAWRNYSPQSPSVLPSPHGRRLLADYFVSVK
jgi:hypothetical protein